MITHKETVLLVTTFMGCYKSVDCPLHAGDKQLWMTRGPKEKSIIFCTSYKHEEWQNGKSYEVQSYEALRKSAGNGMDAKCTHSCPHQRAGGLWRWGHDHLWLWWSRTFSPRLGSSERLRWCWDFCFWAFGWSSRLPWRAGTQQGHVTWVWGQGQRWWAGNGQLLPKKKFVYLLCALCVRNVWHRNSWQTISWTKQERRVNIPIFTDISPCEDFVFVGSLDRNASKNTQKSVHKYFWVNCNFTCWSLWILEFWGMDAGAALRTQMGLYWAGVKPHKAVKKGQTFCQLFLKVNVNTPYKHQYINL